MNDDFVRQYQLSDHEMDLITHALSNLAIRLSCSVLEAQVNASKQYGNLYIRLDNERQVQLWTLNVSD